MITGFRKLVSEPSIKTLEKIDAYIKHYKEVYKTNKTLKADKRLNLDRPIGVTGELLDNFAKLEDDVKHLDEIGAIDVVVRRIGRYPEVLLDDEKNKSKKEIDAYENKFADKNTCKLISKVRAKADKQRKASKEKINQMKFKYSYPIATEEAENAMLDYAVMDEDKSKIFDGIDHVKGSELSQIRDALVKEKAPIIEKGKRYELFKKYSQSADKNTHDSRIEKAINLSDKDEKVLEIIFGINIPSDIRGKFTERDLKAFDAYSRKMREDLKKVKEFDVEMEEYQLAEERSETALKELDEMHSIPDKMKAKIRNSIKAHETKLSKSRRKLEEKKEKYEEKTGIKKELGRVGHYKKLLELHQKYADLTITEEKLLAEADCSIRIDEAKKELEEMKRKAPSEERDQEIEKIERKISWDKARLKEFKEEREGVAEYKGLMKDFVEDTIARARGKDKVTTKALPAGKVEAKEQDKKEEKSNNEIFRENMNKSMEARRTRESSLREGKQNAREEKAKKEKDEKTNDVGEIE